SVYADHIVIDRDGRFETLTLPKTSLGSALMKVAAADQPADRPAIQRSLLGPAPTLSGIFKAQSGRNGFRVFPANGMGGMQDFIHHGLQPGDLVTAVDGVPLEGANVAEVARTVGRSTGARFTIMRNGKQLDVTL